MQIYSEQKEKISFFLIEDIFNSVREQKGKKKWEMTNHSKDDRRYIIPMYVHTHSERKDAGIRLLN